jgi:hypothetical protein
MRLSLVLGAFSLVALSASHSPKSFAQTAPSSSDADAVVKAAMESLQFKLAAETLEKEATDATVPVTKRVDAALRAAELFLALGDEGSGERVYALLQKAPLSSALTPEASYMVASLRCREWLADAAHARTSHVEKAAIEDLKRFHATYKGKAEAAPFLVAAAFRIAKMMAAVKPDDAPTWWKETVDDWTFFQAYPVDSGSKKMRAEDALYADYGGEAEYSLIDRELRDKFDYETGHHRYQADVLTVKKAVDADLLELRDKWQKQLLHVRDAYKGPWGIAAMARVGSLYDSVRTGMDQAQVTYVSPQIAAQLANLNRLAAACQAMSPPCSSPPPSVSTILNQIQAQWGQTKDLYLKDITQEMLNDYVGAVVLARTLHFKLRAVDDASRRLAWYEVFLGQAAMHDFVARVPNPLPQQLIIYRNGEFAAGRMAPVFLPESPASGVLEPDPVAP